MQSEQVDVAVVGGGPGGYTAAIRASQEGLKTLLVERGPLGGTCLNRGCIPTKSLIEDTAMIPAVGTCHFLQGEMRISLTRIMERKNAVVEGSRQWVRSLLQGNRVMFLSGTASFVGPQCLAVQTETGEPLEIHAANVILATGAVEDYGTGPFPDGKGIWSTDEALTIKPVPRRLAIVGAGSRGVEFASIYRNLGATVVLIEKETRILPRLHPEIAERYKRILVNRKIRVLTRTVLTGVRTEDDATLTLLLEGKEGEQRVQADRVLLTGQRRPRFEGLHLRTAGLFPKEGLLARGPGFQSTVPGIRVIGDAAGPPYYAHKAISEALMAVEHLVGKTSTHALPPVPHVLWGDPEVASVGLTEDEAAALGMGVRVGEFHLKGNGRAGTLGSDQGLVLMVSDAKTRQVLGVHVMGPQATELVSLATLAMQNSVDVDGIQRTVFAHPTLSETFFEAALATDGKAIHLLGDRNTPGET